MARNKEKVVAVSDAVATAFAVMAGEGVTQLVEEVAVEEAAAMVAAEEAAAEVVAAEVAVVNPSEMANKLMAAAAAAGVGVKLKKKVKTVKTGVGAEILYHIAVGELDNKEILAAVLAANPARKTTYACVAWYQSKVKAGMIDLPKVAAEEVAEEVAAEADE